MRYMYVKYNTRMNYRQIKKNDALALLLKKNPKAAGKPRSFARIFRKNGLPISTQCKLSLFILLRANSSSFSNIKIE